MFSRSLLMSALIAGFGALHNSPMKLGASGSAPTPRRRNGGKGKGRLGASCPVPARPHTHRKYGKTARRRRRAAALRRG